MTENIPQGFTKESLEELKQTDPEFYNILMQDFKTENSGSGKSDIKGDLDIAENISENISESESESESELYESEIYEYIWTLK